MSVRIPQSFLVVAVLCMAVPALAGVDGPRLTRFPTGVVHPGDVLDLAWSKPAGEVEELEVVLSVDGGERYTIRVTPELGRARDHYTWKVPQLAAAHARLCVRFGEERDEQLSEPTPEFRIEHAPLPGTAPDVRTAWVLTSTHALDWWDEADAAPTLAAGAGWSGLPSLSRGTAVFTPGVMPQRSPAPPIQVSAALCVPLEFTGATLAMVAPPVAFAPQSVPRRE